MKAQAHHRPPLDVEPATSLWLEAWSRLLSNRLAVIGLVLTTIVILVGLLGPFVTPYDFLSQSLEARNQGPSLSHWLGTDDLGRDVLSRLLYGARTALVVATVVTGISCVIGVAAGAIAGYVGGRVEAAIMWIADIVMSVPSLLVVVVLNTSLKPPIAAWMDRTYLETLNPFFRETVWIDFMLVFGTMALILWPPYCRLVRAQVLTIRKGNYVTAARALGLPPRAILGRHILPNALGSVIVAVSAGLGTAMVLESAFSFLGVGVRPPVPSWGNMIADGLRVWRHYPHLLAAPALFLGVATVAFSFLGDGVNDALNPKGRK